MRAKPTIIELPMDKLDDILRRVDTRELNAGDCETIRELFMPQGVGAEKYDATAGSMIALLKYGTGMPFNRMRGLQGNLGVPLPASTQWDIVHAQAQNLRPVFAELVRQASEGDVLHNDDTTVKILELMGKRARQNALAEDLQGDKKKQRTGLFTSGVVSTREGRRIALFFSGRQHAGENLTDVLAQRAVDLAPPIQMCDALCVPDVVTSRPMAWRRLVDNVCINRGRLVGHRG